MTFFAVVMRCVVLDDDHYRVSVVSMGKRRTIGESSIGAGMYELRVIRAKTEMATATKNVLGIGIMLGLLTTLIMLSCASLAPETQAPPERRRRQKPGHDPIQRSNHINSTNDTGNSGR